MIRVTPRVRRHDDRAGDPLDGLVNLFDLGIVLSVAFLLAALSSLNLADLVTQGGLTQDEIRVRPEDQVGQVPADGERVIGKGTQVGTVYRLDDGRLVFVLPSSPNSTDAPE